LSDISSLQKIYNDGVRATSEVPVFIIDKEKLTGNLFNDSLSIRDQFSEQFPDKDFPSNIDFQDLTRRVLNNGPAVFPYDFKAGGDADSICVANGLGGTDYLREDTIKQVLFGDVEEYANEIKIPMPQMAKYIGNHEGHHCTQNLASESSSVIPEVREHILKHSIGSRELPSEMRFLKEMGAERVAMENADPAFVQFMHDVRAYKTYFGGIRANYAANVAFNSGNSTVEEHYNVAKNLKDEITQKMSEELGLTGEEVMEFREQDPELFYRVVDNMVARGNFDDNSILREYVEEHSAATRAFLKLDEMRQVNPNLSIQKEGWDYTDQEVYFWEETKGASAEQVRQDFNVSGGAVNEALHLEEPRIAQVSKPNALAANHSNLSKLG